MTNPAIRSSLSPHPFGSKSRDHIGPRRHCTSWLGTLAAGDMGMIVMPVVPFQTLIHVIVFLYSPVHSRSPPHRLAQNITTHIHCPFPALILHNQMALNFKRSDVHQHGIKVWRNMRWRGRLGFDHDCCNGKQWRLCGSLLI